LKLLVFPHPLTHDYYPYHVPVMHWSDWAPLLSLGLYVSLAVIAIMGWKNKTIPSYVILFYFLTLSIVSNLFLSIGTFMNERFMYHASLGFCMAMAWVLIKKLNFNEGIKKVAFVIFIVAILGFSVKTSARLPDWRNTDALDRSAIKLSPNSARANYFFGMLIWNNVYMKLPPNVAPSRRKEVLDSIDVYFEKALHILPSYNSANSMKAGIAAEYHKLDHNYSRLIKGFEEVNLTGTYEKFVLEYLHYVNRTVNDLHDSKLLVGFYKRMISYYDVIFKNTTLPGEYRSLLNELEGRMIHMQ
jgi:protein O-mannosyl-transferase